MPWQTWFIALKRVGDDFTFPQVALFFDTIATTTIFIKLVYLSSVISLK